ncbi:hypothetical protein [Devosia sp. SL43]|uniref:hypothetical protein n=1 Tax=Devosia sp. SL43 TaxID=2806348 RepID=UPI001F3497D7|nr:hypothetical protein [Devosia sp. SL43]UJW86913.1 hypothetical protein IM737_06620 [Devosia sp. SL43]
MTDRRGKKDNQGKQTPSADAFSSDPRIRELVRFLARRAAEADYDEFLKARAQPRHNQHEGTKP